MAVFGFGILLVGVLVARWWQSKFESRIHRLFSTGTFLSENGSDSFDRHFDRLLRRYVFCMGILFIPLLEIFLWKTESVEEGKLHLMLGWGISAIVIALRFGRAIATGLSVMDLRKNGINVIITKNVTGGAGGLRTLGDYYFYQAIILLIPSAFMLFWLGAVYLQHPIAHTYWKCDGELIDGRCLAENINATWFNFSLAFIAFNVLVVFNGALVIPCIWLRRNILTHKAQIFAPIIEQIEKELFEIRRTLQRTQETHISGHDPDIRALVDRAEDKAGELAAYSDTPTWPISLGKKLVQIVSNISALAGLISLLD